MKLLKKLICKNHVAILSQDSRWYTELLAYLHLSSCIVIDIVFVRNSLSLANIHDSRYDNAPKARGHNIKADFNREFTSVLSHGNQIAAGSHRSHPGVEENFFLSSVCRRRNRTGTKISAAWPINSWRVEPRGR